MILRMVIGVDSVEKMTLGHRIDLGEGVTLMALWGKRNSQ